MYVDTIVEGRCPTRKVVLLRNLKREMKKWVTICNSYRSIYTFSRLNPDGRPDWKSAKLDVIYLDVDVLNSKGELHDEGEMEKIIEWLRETCYSRKYYFTGGGYGVEIDVSNANRDRMYTAHYYLRGELDFNIDKAAIDIARGRRLVPSYNFTKKAYSSFITEEEALLPFNIIHSQFQDPSLIRTNPIIYGSIPWSLLDVKSSGKQYTLHDPGPILEAREEIGIKEIEKRYGKICDTVIRISRQDHVSHQERFFLILYLKDVLLVPYSKFTAVFRALIGNKADYEHSIGEQQGRYAYGKNTSFNPKIFKMLGECPHDCTDCIDRMKDTEDILEGLML